MLVPDVAADPYVGSPSLFSEVQRSNHLRSPPYAFTLFTREKRRLVAAKSPNENELPASSHVGKVWHSLYAANKGPYKRKVDEATAVHRRKYVDYVYNPRDVRRRKQQDRNPKEVTSKLENGSYGDQEEQPSTTSATAQGGGTSEFQQQQHHASSPPSQTNKPRATNAAWNRTRGNLGKATIATTPAMASARSAARPYSEQRFSSSLPRLLRIANKGNTVAAAVLSARRRPKAVLFDKVAVCEFARMQGFATLPKERAITLGLEFKDSV